MVKGEFGVENYAKILCRIYCFQDMIMNFILFWRMFFLCFRVTRNTIHFSAANSIDQSFSQISSVCRSLCNRSQSAVLSMTLYRRQSSAKSLGVLCSFSGRSFMYTKNRAGLRTEPCGTPEVTAAVSDSSPSITTTWVQDMRKSWIQPRFDPWTP